MAETDDADEPGDVGLAATEVSDRRLRERPAADHLQRRVARAKIAGALFATQERVTLGRYHLLELVGTGGMGVVWAAWDPELDRRVAIKLVKATMQAARDRILLEGQALARLSHPNVVPVFDVGVVDEQVYLVMEYVRGQNLRAYCKVPRTVREIVAVYRDAALGLAAAHHAGLIHRDFKPDNAILGDDGRLRVLDFGLARGDARRRDGDAGTGAGATNPDGGEPTPPAPGTELTRGAGTPRYMPPEQAAGGELTPAVDQYAFCVSLREALVGRDGHADGAPPSAADVPRWLDAICTRGTAHEPAARFGSMDEVVRALGRDPRTVWGRRAIATGALGLAAGAFVVGNLRAGTEEAPRCVGAADEIAAVWGPAIEASLSTRLAALSPFAAHEAPTLLASFQRYGASWQESRRGACLAEDRGELPDQMYEHALACLARSKFAFAAALAVVGTATAEQFGGAVVAANALPDATRCATDAPLSNVALPASTIAPQVAAVAREVEDARMYALASHERAVPTATAALDHARALGYAPLVARAELGHGMAVGLTDRDAAAIELERATATALAAGDDPLAIEAFARMVYNAASAEASSIDFLERLRVIQPIAVRLAEAARFERALLYMNLGLAALAAGDRQAARSWFETSRDDIARSRPAPNAELAMLSSNYAFVVDDRAKRTALLAESSTQLASLVGATHPRALTAEATRAAITGDPARAFADLSAACEAFLTFHAATAVNQITNCTFELGMLADERGDPDAARTWLQASLDHEAVATVPRVAVTTNLLALVRGDAAAAARGADAGIAETRDAKGWQRYYAADHLLICGLAREQLHQAPAAIACFRGALAILDDFVTTAPALERRHARVQAHLARLLAPTAPAEARALAIAAAAWYRAATGYDAEAAALEQLALDVTGSAASR